MISQEIAENVIEEHEKINDDMTIGEAQKIENLFDDMSKDLDEELINHAVEKLGYTKGMQYDYVEITQRDPLTIDLDGVVNIKFTAISHDMIATRNDPWTVKEIEVPYSAVIED